MLDGKGRSEDVTHCLMLTVFWCKKIHEDLRQTSVFKALG